MSLPNDGAAFPPEPVDPADLPLSPGPSDLPLPPPSVPELELSSGLREPMLVSPGLPDPQELSPGLRGQTQ